MDNSSATTNTNIHVNNDEMASTDPDSMEASRFDAKPVTGPSTARSTGSSTTNSECVQGDKEDESSGGGPKRQRRIKTEDPPTKDDETTEDKAVASAVPAKSSFRKEEDDQFVEKLLLQLEEEIQKLRSHRNAYDRARFLSPARIRSPALRLMFLRAEEYDARKAARRIVFFFEAKRKLFGDEKLTKTITLDDLDLRDQEALLTESIQVLPCTDTAGRVVLFVAAYYFKFKSWENQVRVKRERSRPNCNLCLTLVLCHACNVLLR